MGIKEAKLNLKKFLDSKSLYYKNIDFERVPKAYEAIKDNICLPKIIHIIGTNGKGSTGRFLAYILYKSGYKVGHYTSPHILRFNERIWIDGKDIDDKSLESAHQKLLSLLPKKFIKTLSYFEYTTLLAAVAFEGVDFAIFEAGLGGEFDATNVFEKKLSLITTIGFDHQEFLGDTIEKIASTKIRSIEKKAVIGYQRYKEVEEIAKKIASKKGAKLYFAKDMVDLDEIKNFMKKIKKSSFLAKNLSLAVAAAKILDVEVDLKKIEDINIFGRMQKILDNVILDVGHNPLAAKEILKELEKKIVLVYNSYEDKDYKKVLKILKPKIKRVQILDIDDERAVKKEDLKQALRELDIEFCEFERLEENENYLVFGSFKVAENFLKYLSRQGLVKNIRVD